tara:strand:+ start:354 stop:767 length:414 start_codon:yes stop_codon:yes gene_type:complete
MSEDRDSLGYWALPLPDIEGKQWKRIPKISRLVPFGYTLDPEDKDYLIPVAEELEALEVAKKHLRQYSYRQVANWLTQQTGRSISYRGLKKRIDIENRRRKVASVKRELARRLEKTLKEVSKLEESTGTYSTEGRTA